MIAFVLAVVLAIYVDPVDRLIAELGDKEYRVRERATADLMYRGEAVVAKLKHAAATSEDAEVRMRAVCVINRLNGRRWLTAEALVDAEFADFPYIDALWYNVEKKCYDEKSTFVFRWASTTFKPYLEHARYWKHVPVTCVLYNDTRSYAEYRRASRRVAIVMVYDGVPVESIREIFRVMHERDKLFYPKSADPPPSYVRPAADY